MTSPVAKFDKVKSVRHSPRRHVWQIFTFTPTFLRCFGWMHVIVSIPKVWCILGVLLSIFPCRYEDASSADLSGSRKTTYHRCGEGYLQRTTLRVQTSAIFCRKTWGTMPYVSHSLHKPNFWMIPFPLAHSSVVKISDKYIVAV